MNNLESRERIYQAIKDVKDDSTRNILYIQFCSKYYPECFKALGGAL